MKPRYRVKAGRRPNLTVVPFPAAEPDPDMQAMVGDLILAIEAGLIDGIAIITTLRDGGVSTSYIRGSNLFGLIGASSYMTRRLEGEIQNLSEFSGVS